MITIAKRNIIETNLAVPDNDRNRLRTVIDANRLRFKPNQLLHIIDSALQIANVHADVTQVSLQHEKHRKCKCNIANAVLVPPPENQRHAENRRLQDNQQGALHTAIDRATYPGSTRAMPPFVNDTAKP